MGKNYKHRTYLDPIHGPIELNLKDSAEYLISRIIDTKEFQRLRRIRQMGLGWFTFHGAEHTRFGHSLGTFFIAKKMFAHLLRTYPEIKKYKKEILLSSVLHDIGHGPFSHTSEKLTNISHEIWTKKIITGNSEVNNLLTRHDKNLPLKLVEIFESKVKQIFLSQIISGYIDCDRLDYLHRDSYYVGVPYGLTGSERIIASLEICKGRGRGEVTSPLLAVNESVGLDAVIHYLHARYSMYRQVYQHKKNLASDFLLLKIIDRARESEPQGMPEALKIWLDCKKSQVSKVNADFYIEVDDVLLMSAVQNWANNSFIDKVLHDLSARFVSRKIFKSLEFREKIKKEKIKEILEKLSSISKQKGLDKGYFGIERSGNKPYEPYTPKGYKTGKAIFIKQQNGSIKELSHLSGLVNALTRENVVKTCLVFAPELEDEITNIKGFQELFK